MNRDAPEQRKCLLLEQVVGVAEMYSKKNTAIALFHSCSTEVLQ